MTKCATAGRIHVLALAVLLAACATPQSRAPLYDQFGKLEGLNAVVDGLVERIHANAQIAPLFANTDMARFHQLLVEYLCMTIGGPCTYTGEELVEVHTGLDITEAEFNSLVEDLIDVMQERNIPRAAQNELLARLAPTRKDIIYQ
jgi:hemoglobin